MTWFYLALLAPLFSAVVNIFDDNLLAKIYKGALAGTVVTGLFGIIPAILIIILRPSSVAVPTNLIVLSLLAGFFTIVGFYSYFKGLEKEDPSVVAALFCLTPAIIPFFAYFIVDERLSLNAIIGFGIVIVSAFIYSLSDIRKFTISKALIPVLIAAGLFDAAAVANKYVYNQVDFFHAYVYFSFGMFIAGLLFLFMSFQHPSTKQNLWSIIEKKSPRLLLLLALVELLALLAQFMRDRALSLGPVSLVAGLQNLQPFYVLIISLLLFPLYPKFFRSAEANNLKIKFLLSILMVVGVFIAVR